jgi:hypothetical protein
LDCVARFPTLQAGILAARRLQWAAQGFSEIGDLRDTSVGLVVLSAEDAIEPMAGGTFLHVLDRAAPGQILLAEHAGKLAEDLPGFSVGPTSGTGVRELLWRRRDDQAARSLDADARAIAWFVEQKGPEAYAAAYPQEPADAASGGEAQAGVAEREARGEQLRPDQEGRQRRGKMPLMIGGLAAAVLLVAAILFFHPFSSPKNPAASESGTQSTSPSGNQPSSSTPLVDQQGQPGTSIGKEPVNPPVPVKDRKAEIAERLAARTQGGKAQGVQPQPGKKQAGQTTAGTSTEPTPPANQGQVVSDRKPKADTSRCELDPSEIGGLIDMADNSLGRGKYKEAQTRYGKVLACDPTNARAREGMKRAHDAEIAENP